MRPSKILEWSITFIKSWSEFSKLYASLDQPSWINLEIMENTKWKRALFKKITKITERVSRFGSAMPSNHQIVLEAELSQEFSSIVDIYRNQKIHNRIQIGLCIFLIMSASFSSKLGFSSMLITLLFVAAILVYLTVCQQGMIQSMQRNLYQICYKSLASSLDNTPPQGEDSGVDEQKMWQSFNHRP